MSLQLNSRPAAAINWHSKIFERLDTYISVLNSNNVASRQAMEDAFESVFHDDLVFNIGGRALNKEEVRSMVFQNFEDTAKISFGKLEVIDACHIECIFCKKSHFERRQILTTIGDKIIRVDPYDDVGTLLYHLNAYISIQNSDGSTLQDLETVFEDIFHDDLVADIEGCPGLRKEDARKMIEEDFAQKAKLSFDKMDVVDESHVEIVIRKEGEWRRHQLLTVQDSKIVAISTIKDVDDLVYNLEAYIRVQNSELSTQQDMDAAFESIFRDTLEANIEGNNLGKEDARAMVFQDFAERAKLSLDKIEIVDESHVEIVISKEGAWSRHQLLGVKDGKIAKIERIPDGVASVASVESDPAPLVAAH